MNTSNTPRWWGMAGVFPGDFNLWSGDPFANQRRFVADHGFHGGGAGTADLTDPARLAILHQLHTERGQSYGLHVGVNLTAPRTDEAARLHAAATTALAHRDQVGARWLVVVVKNLHRFDRDFPVAAQLDALRVLLTPVVQLCRAAGLPVLIENHGDYYVSDLVQLCQAVPGLELLLDTGNCFLIGERPDLLPDDAFPLVRATHWKDHHVAPVAKGLTFQLTGATFGEGHVGLTALYEKLLRLHPDPASIDLMIEWVPDPAKTAWDCFRSSKQHLAHLSAGAYRDPETP